MGRSNFVHYSLVAGAVAVLGGLITVQFSEYLPDRMQMSAATTSLRQQNPACALAEVPRDHVFVAASLWEGGVQTDLVIGTPPTVLKTVRVSVAAGDEPITVFLSGLGVIWDFTGAIERVARVITMSPIADRKVAVAGVSSERVEFVAQQLDCKPFQEATYSDNEMVRVKALAVMFGRPPVRAIHQHKAGNVSLPDASFGVRPEQVNAPGGPRVLDPAHLVSALPVTRPGLLPGAAGIAQLEAAGAIRKPRPEEIEEFIIGASSPYRSKLSPDFRFAVKFDYAVTREVTLPEPPTMKEWHFLVLAGVPAPRISGRACIAQMDGFGVNNLHACYGEAREGIERLRKFPAVDKLASCRVLEVPQQASLEAVATYQPDGANRGFNDKRTPFPIDVRVEKAGDVFLVLDTYEPAIWRVSSSAATRIVGVLLGGHHPSTVEGLAPGTPVVSAELETRASRPKPNPACTALQFWNYSAHRGGPDALVFDRHVLALTGRHIDGLHGAHRLKTVTVR